MPVRRVHSIVLVLFAAALFVAPARAQREFAVSAVPGTFLDTDPAAAKMLGAARDFVAAKQWGDAIELVRQTTDKHGDRLVAVEPGRYVSVQASADLLLSSLPPEGLKQYRAKVDPQVKRWFETAKKHAGAEGLERVVHKAFLSSYGDDALLLLGDLAWDQGLLARARSFWEKLLPFDSPPEAGALPLVLKYPDSSISAEQIRARLILCRLYEGNVDRARQELEAFRSAHPEATGRLAGRSGNLAKILDGLIASAHRTPEDATEVETTAFAGNVERNQVRPRAFDVGAPLWSVRARELRVERTVRHDDPQFERIDRHAPALPARVVGYYPVTWREAAFYCDETEIYAIDLTSARGGQPAWGKESSIYRLPQEFDPLPQPARPRVGLPQFTMMIEGSRLFARLGPVAAPSSRNHGIRHAGNALVCLDLARQGDLQWIVRADDLETDGGTWSFDGAPLASAGRVYVALRRCDPQLQLNVACFDVGTGSARLLWNRKVCNGVEALAGDVDEIRHQLLTLANDRLYYNTNMGAVAALDARDGSVSWAATYPRVEVDTLAAFNRRQQYGPNPCVFHEGLLFAAPLDHEGLLAFDAETGILKWSYERVGRVPQLLGVSKAKLIAAGDDLRAIDIETGRVAWRDGRSDPEAATCGRGLIAGGLVYWPRREEIRIVEAASGRVLRQIDLAQQHGLYGGGNLALAPGLMLVAQSDRIVAFGEFGARKKPARDALAFLRGAGE